MNNDGKKVEEKPKPKEKKGSEVKSKRRQSENGQVDYITKRLPLKDWDKTDVDRCLTIYNIDYTTTEEELIMNFQKVDGFAKLFLLIDPRHPEFCNRGIAYVLYAKQKDAELAIKRLNHSLIGNRRIRIERSSDQDIKPKSKSKKGSKKEVSPPHSSADLTDQQSQEEPYYTNSKPLLIPEHHKRSHHTRDLDYERLLDEEDLIRHHSLHRHRYSSHSISSLVPRPDDYELDRDRITIIRRAHPQIQMVASTPLFRDYQAIAAPAPSLYVERHPAVVPSLRIDNEVEDMTNELSILFDLYRDALLTQNISELKEKKMPK